MTSEEARQAFLDAQQVQQATRPLVEPILDRYANGLVTDVEVALEIVEAHRTVCSGCPACERLS